MNLVVGRQPLDRSESLWLDLVRALSAFFVVLDHAPTLFDMPRTPRWGHQAVIVFFVLSGYVISYVADTRETTGRKFLVARFARLWSVLVPAIALTVVCDIIGRMFGTDPRGFATSPIDHPLIRVGSALLFLSETWVSIQALSNGVVWSLCAEFWYYMLFAAWTFIQPGRTRFVALAVCALLAGFKALLLLPIWLLGVALYRWPAPRRLGHAATLGFCMAGTATVAWVLATRGYTGPIEIMQAQVSPWVFNQLDQARVFWFDWCMGLAVAASLFGARKFARYLPLISIAPTIRWCAGISFAAYLFHMPLLHLCAAFLPRSQGWIAVSLTLCVIASLGPPVERSKPWWLRQLSALAGSPPQVIIRALSRVRLTWPLAPR
jgi:peptidoglycan/LPS O-acetylase OafA/YrhL